MQVFEKHKTEKTVASHSFNQSKHLYTPALNLNQKNKKQRRSGVSNPEIEKLILNLPAVDRSIVLQKLLEASLINRSKPQITKKNLLIMQFVSEGYTYKQISGMLYLSARTVENKVYKLTKEFSCKNKTHLAVKLMRAYVIK